MGDLVSFAPRDREDSIEASRKSPDPLWRELVGSELRAARAGRGDRLVDVAERAGVSTQYLSEVERGRKDPSSEVLAAVVGALDLTVRELVVRVARSSVRRGSGPVCLAA
ncbi:MAG: helix-turn-helix domain-containing protein [Nocardioidaceae bacterium]